jgi:MarR family transcriptional regulator for hemolysin
MSNPPIPFRPPVGLRLAAAAKAVSRAFDEEMAAAGGSMAIWQVLIAVKSRQTGNQRELAASMGIQGATLTHHLNGMEKSGLVTRARNPENRRVHAVELTSAGEELFLRLREVAFGFNHRLRDGLADEDLDRFEHVLDRLVANATAER